MDDLAPSSGAPPRSRAWPFVVGLIALTTILAGSLLYVFRVVSRAPAAAVEEGRRVLADLQEVAAAFRSGSVTTTFLSYATEVRGVSRLQFASLRQTELFERTDEASIFWGQLDLPELVVEARAPVEYTYYLDFDERWEFRRRGRRIEVVAPEIRFNPPAVDASRIEYVVRSGSLLRNEEEAIRRLKTGITQMARRRARQNIPLVEEVGRRETEQFIATWLASRFVDGDEYTVEVRFRHEVGIDSGVGAPRLDDG